MKFKVLIIKKRTLLTSLIFISISILFILIIHFIFYNNPINAFNFIYENKTIKEDLNGDGTKDTLYINNKDNKYYMEVSMGSKTHHLSCNSKLNTLGSFNPYWPVKLQIKDISRDRIPEVFIQSSDNLLPIQHVFTYDNDKFNDIFCSNGNFLGFLDSNNNKTPKFLSGNIQNESLDIGFYIFDGNKLKNYSYDKSIFPGGKPIVNFISYIENLPINNIRPNIFYDDISGNSIDAIDKIISECLNLKFLDGYFIDTAWDEMSNVLELECFLNFKGALRNENEFKLYTLKIVLKPNITSSNDFKINSISILN